MAVVAVDDIFGVTFDSLYCNQQVIFTTHWKLGGSISGTLQLDDFYAAFRNALGGFGSFEELFSACVTPDVNNIKIVIQKLFPARFRRSVVLSGVPNGTATLIGEALPPNVCASLVLHGDLTGPHDKSVKHFLMTDSADCDGGVIQSEMRDALVALGVLLKTNLALAGLGIGIEMIPIIFRRASPALSAAVTETHVMTTSRVLRRRTVGQGT